MRRVAARPGALADAASDAARAPNGTLPPPSRTRVLLAFAAVYVVWGSTYLAIRFAVRDLPPFLMAGLRFVVSGAALYAFARAIGATRPTARQWRSTAIVGGLLLLCGNGGVVWAEQYVPSGLAALLVATVPVWMVVIEWASGGARPTRGVVAGLVLGFAGLAILAGPTRVLGADPTDAAGSLVLVLASLAWAIGSVASKRLEMPESPLLATGMEMLAGGALQLAAATVLGEWGRFAPAAVSARAWLSLAYLIVFGSGIGFTAYIWLLRHVEVAKASTYAYVNPVVAVLLGWALAGESLSARTVVAAAVIVGGVAFITTSAVRPQPT